MLDEGERVSSSTRPKIGFALGGLGGANAHGVGFLQAAKEEGVVPDLISCTSGQIYWVARYLANIDIDAEIRADIKKQNVFPEPFRVMNSMLMAMFGKPGTFRPAIPEYFTRLMSPPASLSWDELFTNRMLPAQSLVPQLNEELFEFISSTFLNSKIPAMFNSFDPETGLEYLYVNEPARRELDVTFGQIVNKTRYMPIDAEGVQGALWIYQYGFDNRLDGSVLVDGAYHRQFIIQELCQAKVDKIYVPRPLFYGWEGEMPQNYFQSQAFTTDLFMNASYAGEISRITFINELLAKGEFKHKDYVHVELIEVQPTIQQGFFDFFVEQEAIYEDSLARSRDELSEAYAWHASPHTRLNKRVAAGVSNGA